MTYSVEFIVNTGQFEHAKLTITCDNSLQLQAQLDATMGTLDNDLALKIGQTQAALKAAVLYGRDNPDIMHVAEDDASDDESHDTTSAMIMSELKAKVVETITHDAPSKPWERPLKAAAPKEWEAGPAKPAAPAVTGMEDF